MFNHVANLEAKAMEVVSKCDDLIDLTFKASGCSIDNADTGAMIGGFIDCYRSSKELFVMQAITMNGLVASLKELKEMNVSLRKQNDEMQQMLRDLSQKVEKIGKLCSV